MELIKDMEAFMHLFAQALARARGDEQAHIFADVVVGHARDIAKQDDDTNEISTAVAKNDEQMLAATPAAEIEKDKDSTTPATSVPVETNDTAADKLAVQTQNEHQDALPDSAKTPEQLEAEQKTVGTQRSENENDHDQTIQQVHSEESAQAAAEERATMDENAKIAEPADKGLYYNAETKVVFVSSDDQPDSNVRPIKATEVADLVKDGATVDTSAQAYAPNQDQQ